MSLREQTEALPLSAMSDGRGVSHTPWPTKGEMDAPQTQQGQSWPNAKPLILDTSELGKLRAALISKIKNLQLQHHQLVRDEEDIHGRIQRLSMLLEDLR